MSASANGGLIILKTPDVATAGPGSVDIVPPLS